MSVDAQSCRVRSATAADLESMLGVWCSAGMRDPAARRAELDAALATAPDLLLVAEQDAEVVAVLLATTDGQRGYLRRLMVAPAWRRRGLGAALVREAERRLAGRGLGRLNVMVRTEEAEARSFWRALGYELEPAVETWVKSLRTGDWDDGQG